MNQQQSINSELSFEFFPPRSEQGVTSMTAAFESLRRFRPDFISVTYGAGGSTQSGTLDAVTQISQSGVEAAPHLTCVGSSRSEIRGIVKRYLEIGIKRLVVLRGDLPGGMVERGEFRYANELISYLREEFGEDLHLEVAAYPDFHPESATPKSDLANFKRKIDAGANSAITQYFFNADSYFAYVDEAQRMGVQVPITPGIMPISNYASLVRFSDICGAELPRWIRARLAQYQDDPESLRAFGFDVVTNLCLDLLENGVHGLHFYALNKADPVSDICKAIGYQQYAK